MKCLLFEAGFNGRQIDITNWNLSFKIKLLWKFYCYTIFHIYNDVVERSRYLLILYIMCPNSVRIQSTTRYVIHKINARSNCEVTKIRSHNGTIRKLLKVKKVIRIWAPQTVLKIVFLAVGKVGTASGDRFLKNWLNFITPLSQISRILPIL